MSSVGVSDDSPFIKVIRFASLDNLQAKAGGGQQPTTPINASVTLHRVTTVANGNDSVTLPAAKAGMFFILTNAHASNAVNVFPNKGEQVNAAGANNAFALAAAKVALFICVTDGQWHTILTA